ncbi:MAG: PAS domain S-box protein, partial [Myxococcales bacterium]|nr:PAS domain S-box protein [Myxococcales bacterium]
GSDAEGADERITELQAELLRVRAELRRAREDLDVFSQLTSGYWWLAEVQQGEDGQNKLERRAWTTRSFTRTTGYDAEHIRRLLRASIIHPEDQEGVALTIDAVVTGRANGGRDQAIHEFRLYGRDGSIMWVRQRLEGRGEQAGRRVYASGELITERKRTEDALGHVEARFLSLVEHAPNVIVTIDLEGTILFVNRQLPGDGREPWELIGSTVFDLASAEGQDAMRGAITSIVTTNEACEFMLRGGGGDRPVQLVGSESPERWYEVQAAPVIRGREVAAITMILTDVTERRLAEQALRRSESRWRFLWENVPDEITELDSDGRIVVTNRSIGGVGAGELYGSSIFALLDPEGSAALREAMDLAESTGEPASYEISKGQPGPDEGLAGLLGYETWWAMRLVPHVEGEARGFLLIGTDVTDRHAAERERANLEAQLRQQQKLESIGTLASGVAHEINNPIQSIMNYADLLRMHAEPGGSVEEFAGEIVAETERVANIVRNLLAFARQEKEHHSPARMIDIIESSLTLMRAVLRRDHILLEIDVPDSLPKIKCRSQQIQQVFMNLLGNARDALNSRYPDYDDDKIVRVSARTVERDGQLWVQTTVEDHGTGITPDVLQRIFDPFFTTKGRDEGTGLGLSVSHGIVREHRGELEVESVEGEYTRFFVSLRVDNGWGFDFIEEDDPRLRDD